MKFFACDCEVYLARWSCHSCGLRMETLHEVDSHTNDTGEKHGDFSIYPRKDNT